jgi:hypothetical protein
MSTAWFIVLSLCVFLFLCIVFVFGVLCLGPRRRLKRLAVLVHRALRAAGVIANPFANV